jgi:hypothetical protein
MADVGQPTSAKPKAKSKRAKGGVPVRIKPTHRPVHFNRQSASFGSLGENSLLPP